MRRFWCGAAIVVLSLCAAAAHAGGEYRDSHKQHGWSVTMPDGWTQAPPAFIRACNDMVRERMPGTNVHYTGGFVREGAAAGAYPYILLQHTPADMAGLTYDKISESMGAISAEGLSADIQKSMSGLFSAVEINTPVLDTANNRIMMRSVLGVPGVGEVKGFSVSSIVRDGLLQFHSYTTATSDEDPAAILQPFLDTLRIDEHAKFVPGKGSWFSWKGAGSGAIKGAIIGAAVGLALGVFKLIRRKAAG